MQNNVNKNLKFIVYSGLSIAVVALATMVIKIPSIRGGYVNFGDIFIFMTAALFGRKIGFIAGGVGSALADILLGYTMYAPATFIIKGIEGVIAASLIKRNEGKTYDNKSLVFSFLIAAVWMISGYFMFEYKVGGFFFGNQDFGAVAAISNLPGNIIQGSVSAAAAIPFVMALKKSKIQFNLEK